MALCPVPVQKFVLVKGGSGLVVLIEAEDILDDFVEGSPAGTQGVVVGIQIDRWSYFGLGIADDQAIQDPVIGFDNLADGEGGVARHPFLQGVQDVLLELFVCHRNEILPKEKDGIRREKNFC